MIFRKKKTKLNPKVRFQHKDFTGQLQTARTYKRKVRTKSDDENNDFWAKIGLAQTWRKILVVLVLISAGYLVYAPNFLSLRTISVTGLSDNDRLKAVAAIQSSLAEAHPLNPQRNLLFTNTTRIEQVLLGLGDVQRIAGIKKDFLNQAILIEAEAKYTKFIIATDDQVYDVFNDGTLRGVAGISRQQWQELQDPKLVKIKVTGHLEKTSEGSIEMIASVLRPKLIQLQEQINAIPEFRFSHFDFTPDPKSNLVLQTPAGQEVRAEEITLAQGAAEDLENNPNTTQDTTQTQVINKLPLSVVEIKAVVAKPDNSIEPFTVYFDTQIDIVKTTERLKMLLSQTSLDRLRQLSYIDMRISDKAYLCLRNTPCQKPSN